MKKIFSLIIILASCLSTGLVFAQKTSIATADWSNPNTWSPMGVPAATDNVIIASGHAVTIDNSSAVAQNISFGDATSKLIMGSSTSVLSVYGNFTLASTTHSVFTSWATGAKIKFTGSALQSLSGWSTSGNSTSFMEVVVDKTIGSKVTTSGSNMRFCFGNSLEIISGTFELAATDDIETKNLLNAGSAATITIQASGTFSMGGGTSYIRRGTFSDEETSKIGKVTVFGTANLGASSTIRMNFGGLDIENGGLVEFLTGLSTGFSIFNPGPVNIKSGGVFKNNLTTSYWFANVTNPTTITLNGGEFNFAASQPVPQFIIPAGLGGTVRFSNTGNQTLPAAISEYENLIFSNSGIKTLGANTAVNGSLSIRGTATFSRGAFTLNYGPASTLQYGSLGQTSAQTASAEEWPTTSSPKNLTIYNTGGVTIPAGLDRSIAGTVTLSAGNLTSNSVLTLISNASGTGRIAALPVNSSGIANSTVTGTVNLQRYIPGMAAYRYLAHPFSSAVTIQQLQDSIDITGAGAGLTPTSTNASSAFSHNPNTTSIWDAFTNATDVWNSYNGIAVYVRGKKGEGLNGAPYSPSDATIATRGTVNQGSQTIALAANSANLPTGTGSSYRLIGNPFPSSVDMSLTTARTNLTSTYYVWDLSLASTSSTYGPGAYVAVPFTTSYAVPSSAGFFVQLTDSTKAGSITFPESSKTSNTIPNQLFRTSSSGSNMNLQLESGSVIWDRLVFNFGDAYSTAYEFGDANKMRNPQVNLFSLSSNNSELAIDNRPVTSTSVIKLGMTNVGSGDYTLRVTDLNLPSDITAFIKDKFNSNNLSPLTSTGTFNFTVTNNSASSAVDRFEIVFAPLAPLPVSLTNVSAYTKNTGVEITWSFASEINMDKYVVERSANGTQFSAIGNVLSRGNSSITTNYNLFDAAPVTGANYYRIKMIDKNSQASYSRIVRVNLGAVKSSLTVYPNPVVNEYADIQLNNLSAGNYSIRVINSNGQTVASKSIAHSGGSASESISMSNVAKGIYQVIISNNNESFTETIIRK